MEKYKKADAERTALMSQVKDCECFITEQEAEIKQLISHIDRLTEGNDKQQVFALVDLCSSRNRCGNIECF